LRAEEVDMTETSEDVKTEAPLCCGGGDFYGHEPFCDCGHVLAEEATRRRIALLEAALSEAADVLEAAAANAAGHTSAMPQDGLAYELLRACAQQARSALGKKADVP
jgi:hypothetical protein